MQIGASLKSQKVGLFNCWFLLAAITKHVKLLLLNRHQTACLKGWHWANDTFNISPNETNVSIKMFYLKLFKNMALDPVHRDNLFLQSLKVKRLLSFWLDKRAISFLSAIWRIDQMLPTRVRKNLANILSVDIWKARTVNLWIKVYVGTLLLRRSVERLRVCKTKTSDKFQRNFN